VRAFWILSLVDRYQAGHDEEAAFSRIVNKTPSESANVPSEVCREDRDGNTL
jgi:hypothetical protein